MKWRRRRLRKIQGKAKMWKLMMNRALIMSERPPLQTLLCVACLPSFLIAMDFCWRFEANVSCRMRAECGPNSSPDYMERFTNCSRILFKISYIAIWCQWQWWQIGPCPLSFKETTSKKRSSSRCGSLDSAVVGPRSRPRSGPRKP